MLPFSFQSFLVSSFLATILSVRGAKRKTLSRTGAITAWLVGFLSLSCGWRGFILIFFYLLGTLATKYRKDVKQSRDASFNEGSVRGPYQVLACSFIAVLCSIGHAFLCGEENEIDFKNNFLSSALTCSILAHYSCCCGDTFASELGMLSSQMPILVISPLRRVPHGTNGGITVGGTLWSAIGGAFMGVALIVIDAMSNIQTRPFETIAFGMLCGFLGSLIDSLLGATLQATFYDKDKKIVCSSKENSSCVLVCGYGLLSNAQVNLLSVFVITYMGGFVIGPILFR